MKDITPWQVTSFEKVKAGQVFLVGMHERNMLCMRAYKGAASESGTPAVLILIDNGQPKLPPKMQLAEKFEGVPVVVFPCAVVNSMASLVDITFEGGSQLGDAFKYEDRFIIKAMAEKAPVFVDLTNGEIAGSLPPGSRIVCDHWVVRRAAEEAGQPGPVLFEFPLKNDESQ